MEPLQRRKIDPQQVRFYRGADQKIYMESAGGTEGPLTVKWAFPLTRPDKYVVVSDEKGAFVGLIKNYKKLDPASLAVVQEGLEESYFLPRITRIREIEDRFRIMIWTVDTDRGPRRFEVRSRRRDIRWLSDRHVVIQDVDGNRYEIEDIGALDAKSRDLLEMEV